MFLYRDILKRSATIAWNHKNLWFFGIFAALLEGVGQYSMTMSRSPEDWTNSAFSAIALLGSNGNIFYNFALLFKTDPVSAITFSTFISIILIFVFFIFWLAVISQGGLINNAAAIIKNNIKKGDLPIRDGLEKGIKKFWPVLAYNLIGAALICFLAALVGAPLVFLTGASGLSTFFIYIILFIIFIPLTLIIYFLAKYAVIFCVVKDRKFVDAMGDALRLFGKYWLISLEMALILFAIDFLGIIALALVILILAIPFIFAMRILALIVLVTLGFSTFLQISLTGGVFLALALVVLTGAALTVFKVSAWTDIFISLVERKGGLAKLERLAAGMRKK
jgi:hypothetical protein